MKPVNTLKLLTRRFACILAASTFGVWPGTSAAEHISGRVEVLEKGDVKEKLIRDVVVFVDGLKAPLPEEPRRRRFQITSQNKAFGPRVEAVPVGAVVSFPNLDPIMHNVFSLSPSNKFDLGLYKAGAAKDQRLDGPGLVRIYCNIHPQMSAFVLVLENPYFTEARPDGTFRIENVPPGTYTVKAWFEKAQAEKVVVVGAQGASNATFLLDARRFKTETHMNKFGKPYGREKY